jgi:hypothetical protein
MESRQHGSINARLNQQYLPSPDLHLNTRVLYFICLELFGSREAWRFNTPRAALGNVTERYLNITIPCDQDVSIVLARDVRISAAASP